jgi:hypothetical protein
MTAKTEGIKVLVQEVLTKKFSEPYRETIILDVFLEIQKSIGWKKRYGELSDELHNRWTVNKWIGKYTKELTGLKSLKLVPAPDDSLITAYTKLG